MARPRSMHPRRGRIAALVACAPAIAGASALAEDFYIDDGDVIALTAAIVEANGNGEPDTIHLAESGHYLLEVAYDSSWGGIGLPQITSEITIEGNGATIERSSEDGTPNFRFFYLYNFDGDANLTLIDLTLTGGESSSHGGAVRMSGETVTLIGCTLSNNTSLYIGGAIHTSDGGELTIIDSTLVSNTGTRGGAINKHGSGGSVIIIDSVIADNAATDSSGGGGLFIESSGTHTITGTTISGNTAASESASAHGGGVRTQSATMTLTDCTISDNHTAGGSGGGIYSNGTLHMFGTTVSGNSAESTSGGGGIRTSSSMNMTNCTVSGNVAAGGPGGGILVGGSANITHSTIADNTAANQGAGLSLYAPTNFSNSIVAYNAGAADIQHVHNFNDLGYNIVEDGSGISDDTSMSGDPMLDVLADNGGPTQTHALLPGSIAIDAGDCAGGSVAEDQRGVVRPQNDACDIGAFEFEFDVDIPGDLDGDGCVDQGDLALLLSSYGIDAGGDVNGDGITDQADLALLLANWGEGC